MKQQDSEPNKNAEKQREEEAKKQSAEFTIMQATLNKYQYINIITIIQVIIYYVIQKSNTITSK